MARAYSGVFRAGSDAHALWVADWPSFEAKWRELSGQGLRLASISVSVEGGQPQFSGVFRAGSDGHALWVAPWASFEAKWSELSGQGLRLVSLATYVDGGQPMFAGAFRQGSDGYALWVAPWASFEAKWNELSGQGLRLVSLATYVDGGQPMFAGAFRQGSDGYALWVAEWASFEAKWQELSAQGLRIVSIDSYVHQDRRIYAGVYRSGSDGHALWVGVDWENFVSRWREYSAAGLRLVDTAGYPHPCTSDCLNQVVMPEGAYNYMVSGDTETYRWPVDEVGAERFVRLSAIEKVEPFLTLPFSDTAVTRGGIWRYEDGGYHHAGDYSRGDDTFQVLASADGEVIFVGWDNWSGNTVIVSHDVGGTADAYRTIYMHLRDGADHDCDAAWNQTVPTLSGDLLDEYVTHLNETGCPQTPPRNPVAAHWGTNAETIPVTVGQQVGRGEFLAWAGNTGPGGKRGSGGPNTHLHIFWCRRDPTDGRWYFFDPYGVYALPDCYAAGITDATSGPCVRYPVAWLDGRPQYPGQVTIPFSDTLSRSTRRRLPTDPEERTVERERTRLPWEPR